MPIRVWSALPFLPLPEEWIIPAVRQTPSAEANAWAQCVTPTDLKVCRTSLMQASRGDTNGYYSKNSTKEYNLHVNIFSQRPNSIDIDEVVHIVLILRVT